MFFQKKNREEIEFPKIITINDIIFNIEIIFSKKKSSSVTFNKNKIIFRLSSYLSNKEAKEHFNSLLNKITRKISNQNKENFNLIDDILKKGKFEFAKKEYLIEFSKIRGVKFKNNIFYVNYHLKPELIEKYIVKYLIKEYTPKVENYVNQLNQSTFNFNIKSIELKLVKSKWGHCTFDNKLMFNLKLLNADLEILNYVIIHELSHIKHKNHSINFWNEVSRFCKNHKYLRKKLKNNPPNIFN